MKIANIDFPKPLLNALRDGELVVFAGAGVSMGEPACLPNFKTLADIIAQGTGKALQEGEPIDRFLGRLQRDGVKVHGLAKEVLSPPDLKATDLHRNLLRLYSNTGQVRIVTTNFDLLFQQAAEGVFNDSQPEVFRAPALPLGHQFNGIVHVHGVVSHPDEMTITDADFGRAYLTESWARRFLVDLFSSFTVLFVGYSHDDTIMNYLARALPSGEADRRFALIGEKDDNAEHWDVLGIKQITYQQIDGHDYSALYEGIYDLSDLVQLSVPKWHSKITAIAKKPPPLDEKSVDLIEYALGDATKTRFFKKAASDPDWIDWLDKRGILNALFEDGTLSDRDQVLSWWLAENFTCDQADKLFLLIGKHNMRLNPHFWDALGWTIGREETPLDKDISSRWISLFLATVHDDVSTDHLLWLGEHCIKQGMLDSLLQVFDAMADSRLLIKEDFNWPDEEHNESSSVDVELLLIDHFYLERLWEGGLKPKLSQIAEPLLDLVIRRLKEQYLTSHAWQKANRDYERASHRRSAIEPHDQDNYPKSIDLLIDVARDCLEWLASNQAETAAQWCDQLVDSDAPLLRRLAVHGVSKRENLTADAKIDWLLTHIGLHDWCAHHEIFVAVREAYPKASSERREALIKDVWVYRWRNDEDPERERRTAYKHFDWFDWLHKSDPNCPLAKQAMDEVLANYSFEPSENPDLTHWIESGSVNLQSPFTVEELLAKPPVDWLDDMLSFQDTEWDRPNRRGLILGVTEAIKQNFDWSLDLADALAEAGEWNVDLWLVLIRSWSEMALDEDKHSKVLRWLGKSTLYPEHHNAVTDALYALVKNGGTSYALNLLPQANKIASNLWHHLDQTSPVETLINFWLSGFVLWRQQQDPVLTALSDEYHQVLSGIIQDQKLPGRRGRTILAGRFAFLLDVDEAWTRENLLPLFDPGNSDFQAAWDGFLTGGHLNSAVADVMADLFLKAVDLVDSDLADQRDQFINYYTEMLVYFVDDPFDKWILALFQLDSPEARQEFVFNLSRCLQNLDEAAQQELWQRWLKQYWKNRLQGVPAALESGEIISMLNWLPHLTAVFSEAVDLAVQMQKVQLKNYWGIDRLNKSDLSQRHPEALAKLLIYLWECNLPNYTWVSGQELIDKLLKQDINITSKQKQKLKEIKIQL